jgi:hypothetical protein
MSGNTQLIPTNTFATQSGNILLSTLDTNFNQIASFLNNPNNYTNYLVDSGVANAYVVTFPTGIAPSSYAAGLAVTMKVGNANTTASTINVNSLGVKSIVKGGGTALSSGDLPAGAVVTMVYDGTNFVVTSLTSSSSGVRSGITTVTLTSASPNATLTYASNQFISITNDTTLAVGASVTLPDMTTLTQGAGYFIFANNSIYNVALKDIGGTVREYIAPGANYILNIKSISTSTGVWQTAFPSNVVSYDQTFYKNLANNFKVNSLYSISAAYCVSLDATDFALVWFEASYTTTATYAKLFTVNPSTKAITAGNQVTIGTSITNPFVDFVYDTDNAGHAFCILATGVSGGSQQINYWGLSVSGGTLYVSSLNTVTQTYSFCSCNPTTLNKILFCGYLGSNNAYAFGFSMYAGGSINTYIRGATVTGTTTVTVTNSASNLLYTPGSIQYYGARTDLTSFVSAVGAGNANNKAYLYNPAANTFTALSRTGSSTALLDIEQGSIGRYSSFAMGGFMYSSGHAFHGANVYDTANLGTATATALLSTGYSFKYNQSAAFETVATLQTWNGRSSIYVGSTSIIAVDGSIRWQCDPSQTTLNLQKSGSNPASGVLTSTLLTSTLPMYVSTNILTQGSVFNIVGDCATPITL